MIMDDTQQIGKTYLDALSEAEEAHHKLKTNDGDNYDPCGTTEKRVKADFNKAIIDLALATKELLSLIR